MNVIHIIGTCNGLVCLYNYFFDDPLYIYNPFTIEYIELPRLDVSPNSVCRVVFGFGFCRKVNEYKVVKILYYKQANNDFVGGAPEAIVLSTKTPTWRKIGKISYDLTGPTSEALVDGKLHWLTFDIVHEDVKYREIISFDLETDQFQVVPRPSCGGLNRINYHLLTVRGCLSAVVSCNGGSNEIWVMKEYNVRTSWRKEMIITSYVPQGLRLNMAPPARRKKNGYLGRRFRVLCVLKNGELLLLYQCRCIVSYNPDTGEFKDVNFQGLPLEFLAFVHVGSLISTNRISGVQNPSQAE
ncbi:F-box protein At3g07870-like [Mercurialis annua]|uniref:F-box protein At3g07870-like n=1 Tax=Mercurialis annua TaxID=3986 RepID=UPI002160C462|nr:F-box protein At3g07870-like [Mercurialis annua]